MSKAKSTITYTQYQIGGNTDIIKASIVYSTENQIEYLKSIMDIISKRFPVASKIVLKKI